MDIITSTMLDSMSRENQRKFQELLPLLIKKLILNSCKSISNIRMPHGDDIYAPNFDGTIYCAEQSTYVPSGLSVWEFGTNSDYFKKINEDYEKRTRDSLGIEKKDACFCLVTPKLWANASTSIEEWETERTDWKQVKVYDASVLCDWINSEPAVCAWLIEEIFHKPIDFSTLEYAWIQFSNKTSPPFLQSLFLTDREKEVDHFISNLSSPIVRVKADTFVEATGFVFSAMLQNPVLKEKCIVINSKATYHIIGQFVKEKTIILNYPCDHDINNTGDNNVVLCFGKEDVGIKPDIVLKPLSKYHFTRAFKDMGISNPEDLYHFTHGNLRALIRRIPGSTIDRRPDWANREKKDLLAPLLFLRIINWQSEDGRYLVELLSGETFEEVEKEYQDLIRMEDSPIKVVDNYYILVNYEEAWNTLQYTINSPQFTRLTDAIITLLETVVQTGTAAGGISSDSIGRSVSLNNMFVNYVYFSFDDPDSYMLKQAIQKFLDYFYKPNTFGVIMQHLSVLAEACPDIVVKMLDKEAKNEDGLLYELFDVKGYDSKYTDILFAIDRLTLHTVSVIWACRILFRLYQKHQQYKLANNPENSLTTALCLINTTVPLDSKQKVELLLSFFKENPRLTSRLMMRILERDSYVVPSLYGKRERYKPASITYAEYFDAMEAIAEHCFIFAVSQKDIETILSLIQKYNRFRPEFFTHLASLFQRDSFDSDSLANINFQLRKKKYNIQCWKNDGEEIYLAPFDVWIQKTNSEDITCKWMFFEFYGCPDERLLPIDDNYSDKEAKTMEFRKKAIHDVIKNYGLSGICTLLKQMKDFTLWGFFLATNIDTHYHVTIAEKALEYSKMQITAGILDHSVKETFDTIYERIPADMRKQLFASMYRTDMAAWLKTEDEKRNFWFGKSMVKYEKGIYEKLLKYYPAGLLYYCHESVKESPIVHLDMVMEIVNAIRKMGIETDKRFSVDYEYELMDTLKIIDQALYTEGWGKFCKDLYVDGFLKEPNMGAAKYLFYHPIDLIRFVENDYSDLYYISNHYLLPGCAYKDQEALHYFAESLVQSNLLDVLGSIFGRSIRGTDGIFPHESIRNLLEELDNEKLDREVYIGYLNSRGARIVLDGTDQRRYADQFKEASHSLAITYPHTSSILKDISEDYMREANRDFLQAELRS